jgi:hypothetical protein
MKLYHFCPEWMLDSILKEGLTKGKMLLNDNPPSFRDNMQWLTINKDFDQSWNKYSTLPYSRTDYRLTIKLPNRNNLFNWKFQGYQLTSNEMYDVLSSFGDPENWYVYNGVIKAKLIKKVVRNPSLRG